LTLTLFVYGVFVAELEQQVISKERVTQNGEVFTAKREVNAMLDLVKKESYRIESTFLEPSCGTGNFLVEILRRKLITASQFADNQVAWEKAALQSLSTIYGIELMEDNAFTSRMRLSEIFEAEYKRLFDTSLNKKIIKAANFIIGTNIIVGNTLEMKTCLGSPILFTEWIFDGDKVVRKEFSMQSMIEINRNNSQDQCNLFTQELLPIKTYRPMKYENLGS
jgi:hypothetical protein